MEVKDRLRFPAMESVLPLNDFGVTVAVSEVREALEMARGLLTAVDVLVRREMREGASEGTRDRREVMVLFAKRRQTVSLNWFTERRSSLEQKNAPVDLLSFGNPSPFKVLSR